MSFELCLVVSTPLSFVLADVGTKRHLLEKLKVLRIVSVKVGDPGREM